MQKSCGLWTRNRGFSGLSSWSLVFLVLIVFSAGCGEGPLPATGKQYSETFYSELMGQDYILRYRLPPAWDQDRDSRFQVVYQLDPTFVGLKQMAFTVGTISELEETGEIEPTIVVGIDYPAEFDRFRDYDLPNPLDPEFNSDHADLFYKVVRDEIVPHVDATLRTRTDSRTIVGHSMGGLFALYAAFRYDPEAPLFTGAVANDPSYSEDLFTYERWLSERTDDLPMRIYLAMATWNGPGQKLTHDWMNERLEGRNYPSLKVAAQEYDTDHGGVIGPGFEDGLRFVLGGE